LLNRGPYRFDSLEYFLKCLKKCLVYLSTCLNLLPKRKPILKNKNLCYIKYYALQTIFAEVQPRPPSFCRSRLRKNRSTARSFFLFGHYGAAVVQVSGQHWTLKKNVQTHEYKPLKPCMYNPSQITYYYIMRSSSADSGCRCLSCG